MAWLIPAYAAGKAIFGETNAWNAADPAGKHRYTISVANNTDCRLKRVHRHNDSGAWEVSKYIEGGDEAFQRMNCKSFSVAAIYKGNKDGVDFGVFGVYMLHRIAFSTHRITNYTTVVNSRRMGLSWLVQMRWVEVV